MNGLTSSKIVFFLVFCFITTAVNAQQIKQFSSDKKSFEKELKSFFQNDKDDETQKTVDDFLLMVEDNSFSDAEYNVIIKTLNTLLSKHYRQPHFLNYFQCLIAYKEKNLEQNKFNQYHKAIEKLTKESKKKFEDFGRIIYALFSYKAIYSDKSKTWLIGDNDYEIIYEDFPVIEVHGKLNLTCYSPGDTIKIINTTGTFYPFSTKWVGEGGRIDWRRVMMDTNKVYALLNTYNIDISKTEILADSVRFYHTSIFNYPLIGEIHDKGMSAYRGINSAYPVFRSYDAVHIHARLAVHTVYIGGFSMQGRKMIGSSNAKRKAKLIILYKGIRTLIAESDIFDITPEKIIASDAAITIYFSEDSFYHPKLIFDYQINEKAVSLTRGKEGLYRSPMINTYHNIEMEFDQIKWIITEPTMSITLLKGSQGSAMFASKDFFLQGIYMGYQGILSYHPIEKMKRYCEKYNTRRFNITEYAVYNQSKPENLQPLMIRLAMGGFIFYDIQTGMIDVREKTFLYVNADKGKQDYDMIRFESIAPQKDNAQFSLNTGNLIIEGVSALLLSDSQNVYIVPANKQVTLKQNRDFLFDGYVRAGRFEFFGNRFFFNYEQYRINMRSIDSMRFYVPLNELSIEESNLERGYDGTFLKTVNDKLPVLKSRGEQVLMIQSVIQNVNGYLYIDHPQNKSGYRSYPEYPVFDCNKASFVYYDNPKIHKGAYDRRRFYFLVKPFRIDSLDNFNIYGAEFNGSFYSGGIVPEFDYKLVPQKHDLSLGFTKAGNYPLYNEKGDNKGKGELTINLSNSGLRGRGNIDYLSSITTSPGIIDFNPNLKESGDFILYLDDMRNNSQTFNIAHNAMGKYPQVKGTNVYTQWFPYNDTMIITKKNDPFYIFEKEVEFNGTLILTPDKLTSSGLFRYQNSEITSKLFDFKSTKLLSNDALLKIKSEVADNLAFVAPKIKLDLDLETNIALGICQDADKQITMPYNQYQSSMWNFKWDISNKNIELKKGEKQSELSSNMLSLHHDQDNLIFQSTYATLDMNEYIIKAENIPYIAVADAHIYPKNGIVEIEKAANMRSLKESKIKTDTNNFYHEIYRALVNIFGKYKYTGYGFYDYIDKYKNKEVVYFYQIRVDDQRKTFARANIVDTLNFHLSPHFGFKGQAELNGDIKDLRFDGYVLADHKQKYRTQWFRYNNRVNIDTMRFLIQDPIDINGNKLYTGIYMGSDSPFVYNAFMGHRTNYSDLEVFQSRNGVLFFDDDKNSFVLADTQKIFHNKLEGQYFSMNIETGDGYHEGIVDFGFDHKVLNIASAGFTNYKEKTNNYIFDVIMTIDFPFDKDALKKMSSSVIDVSFDKKNTNDDRPMIAKAISELMVNEKEKRKMLQDLESFKEISLEKSFVKTLVFSDLRLSFDIPTRYFRTIDKTIGLNSIDGAIINKMIPGGIRISKKRSGSLLEFYLEPAPDVYYYFNFKYGIFQVLSSDPLFTEDVVKTMSKISQAKYRIAQGSDRQRLLFKRRMELD